MDSGRVLWEENVPLEIANDILLRLPVKSLGRYMCTCKILYFQIKSCEFITRHLNHSKVKGHSILVIQEDCCNIFSEFGPILIEQERGQMSFLIKQRELYVLGSCKGLVLVRLNVLSGYLVFLWNPSLNKFKIIDSIMSDTPSVCAFALGFSEASNDFRLVRIARYYTYSSFEQDLDVYSLNEDNWNRADGTLPNGSLLPSIADSRIMAIYINGIVHWIAMYYMNENYWFVILKFDFEKDVPKVMELLCDNQSSHSLELKELNGKLALFGISKFYFTWVMIDYPLVETCTNNGCLFRHVDREIWPIVCTQKKKCIFKTSYVEYDMPRYYNAKKDKIYELDIVAPYKIVDYIDCLVLLDVENEVLDENITPYCCFSVDQLGRS